MTIFMDEMPCLVSPNPIPTAERNLPPLRFVLRHNCRPGFARVIGRRGDVVVEDSGPIEYSAALKRWYAKRG